MSNKSQLQENNATLEYVIEQIKDMPTTTECMSRIDSITTEVDDCENRLAFLEQHQANAVNIASGEYSGTGLSNGTSTVEFNFDFSVKLLHIARRRFVPKGTGSTSQSTENKYIFENGIPIDIEALRSNTYSGSIITTEVTLQHDTGTAKVTVSDDGKHIVITSSNAIAGVNSQGDYYHYVAI